MNAARHFLVWLIVAVFERLGVELQHPQLGFTVGPVSNKRIAQGAPPMKILLTTDQKVTIALNPKTPGGHPATLDGTPSWSTSDQTVIAVQPAEDGKSCSVIANGAGLATMGASADADLGEGVTTITGEIEFEVVAAEASDLGFEVGTPENQ